MYITTDIVEFKINHVFLHEPVKNIMKSGCDFIKIMYSNNNFVMNGIYIDIKFNNIELYKRKEIYKMKIDTIKNEEIIKKISKIEESILNLLPDNLYKVYSLNNIDEKYYQLKKYNDIILRQDVVDNFGCVLRIFGIWKDNTRCGLNYQYIY